MFSLSPLFIRLLNLEALPQPKLYGRLFGRPIFPVTVIKIITIGLIFNNSYIIDGQALSDLLLRGKTIKMIDLLVKSRELDPRKVTE